jgi:outer membrane protein assembly factor BamE (lipoprotein component of BamABCDE complex)
VRTLALLLLSAFVFTGCVTSTVESRKKEHPNFYASLPPDQKTMVDEGKIKVGMSPDAVYLAWGQPAEVLEEENPEGHTTIWDYVGQWVEEYRYWIGRRLEFDYYPRDYIRAQIFFRNGAVVSWRTLPKPVE